MPTYRPHPDACRQDLHEWAGRRDRHLTEAQALMIDLGDTALRARGAGLTMTEIAGLAGVTRQTVYSATNRRR